MKKLIFYTLLFFILISSFIIYSNLSQNYFYNTPDETLLKSFGENYANSGRLYLDYDGSLISEYSRPRGTEIINGRIVPTKFLGFPIFLGPFSLIGSNYFSYITPFLASLLLLWVILFSKRFYEDERIGFIWASSLMLLPFFWYWSNHSFMENVSAVFFIFIFQFFLFKFVADRKPEHLILASLFAGVSVAFRYDFLLLIFILAIPNVRELIKVKPLHLVSAFFVFLLFLSPSLIASKQLYGGTFDYGEKILNEKYDLDRQWSISNIGSYFGEVFLFFPLILFTFVGMIYRDKINQRIALSLLLYLVLMSVIIIAYNPLKQPNILHESYTRYILWSYISASMFVAVFIVKQLPRKISILFILTFLLMSTIAISPILFKKNEVLTNNEAEATYLLQNIGDDTLLIVGQTDKYIPNDITTLPLSLFDNDKRGIDYALAANVFSRLMREEGSNLVLYSIGVERDKLRSALLEEDISLTLINLEHELYLLEDETTN